MKNRYGITPWGSWFIDVLDSYRMGERLDRGRSYANTGKVSSLDFNKGRVKARVKGNYKPFYNVQIIFPPLKEAEQVYKMIEDNPPLLARIATGELPEAFLHELIDNDINLIPLRWRDMERSCDCPDYGDPCKHMAALYYIIAREIDADPHVLFRLRGLDLAARFGKKVVHQIRPPFAIKIAQAGKDRKKPPQIQAEQQILDFEIIPHCRELISSLLPPSSPFTDKNFAMIMTEFYHRFAIYKTWEGAITEQNKAETEHRFSRSRWTVFCPDPQPGAEALLLAEDINGRQKKYSLHEAFNYFVHFSSEDGTVSYSFLFYLFKFFNLLCSAGAFIPYVLSKNETLRIIWRPFETLPQVFSMQEALGAAASRVSLECGMLSITAKERKGSQTASGRTVVDLLASAFLNDLVRRRFLSFRNTFNRYGTGEELQELLRMFFEGAKINVSSPAQRSLPAAIDQWLSALHTDFTAYRYSLTVKDLNKNPGADLNVSDDFRFGLSMEVLTEDEEGIKKTPLSQVKDLEILRAPIALSNYLPEIKQLTAPFRTARSHEIRLSEERLISFLDSAAPLLVRLGMTVNLPKSLHRELKPRLVVSGSLADSKKNRGSLVRFLDLTSLQDFEWQIAIGDKVLTHEEFKKLLKEKKSLVRFKDGFVKLDTEEFARLLKKAKEKSPNFNDFLRAHFSGDTILAFDARETINNLFREQNLPVPVALNAELRPYQKRGYNWVCSLLLSGFGCILADDMGLGKTVQSIAALLHLKDQGLLLKGCLVVAPAALLNNWEKELSRFAPSLGVSRYHGNRRQLDRKQDLFLTTYQTAVRDAEKLKKEAFSMLLVDEAHLMKNAETRISRTVKQLRSQYRLALSGTPVENRLEDLRSLFDFILPGYLGNAKDFKELYRVPIEVMRNREQAEALRKITSPFLLRRLKTDKTIIKDLPDKVVTNNYAVLEKEQAALYKSVVDESIRKSEKCEKRDRSALILLLLTSLKQICDHPRVFDKESPAESRLSGKAQLLLTLLEEILANREKTLVFSQYVETLDCLERIIKKELGEAPLVYHGGLSQNARSEIISRFQTDPAARILLVSLRAGGLGLNLTAASRVIHYDLWYNPAVENQATDRAFRIGQERTVFVHRFITKNSFEEKIDAMISSKQELADMTVSSGESWLARMSHEELRELFER